jgi:hypothetical protein
MEEEQMDAAYSQHASGDFIYSHGVPQIICDY